MDVQTGLIYVAVVVISALVIGFVSIFAMKEKSYEDAIREQRNLPDDLLFGRKEKVKEKKHKNKANKKPKEKKEEKEEVKEIKEEKSEHVQFEENPQILPAEPTVQDNSKGNKKKNKAEKIKPILVNKDESILTSDINAAQITPVQEVNHFDVTQPKDDLELIRSHSRENLHQASQPAEASATTAPATAPAAVNKSSPKDTPTRGSIKKNAKDKDAKKKDEPKEEKKESSPAARAAAGQHQQQAGKDKEVKETKEKEKPKEVTANKEGKEVKENVVAKETAALVHSTNRENHQQQQHSKKNKKQKDILAQIGGDKDGVNFSLLQPLVQKAELSRSEIQFLIESLLNKQQENPAGEQAEWSEGRADPVMKLKRQLADKEKALRDEQEATAGVQSKLIELRQELNSERSRYTATVRQLEEALTAKTTEAATLHTRMQHILESHAAEKQGYARQIEQLQTKINEDAAIIVKMQEDQGHSHGQMQQEMLNLRKQHEFQLNQLREQLSRKSEEITQIQAANMTLQQEFQATCDSSAHEIEVLRSQLVIADNDRIHLQGQIQQMKESADQVPDLVHQLEEALRQKTEIDQRMKQMLRHEQELQKQISRIQPELSTLNLQLEQARNELATERQKSEETVKELTEAKTKQLQKVESELQDAKARINELQQQNETLAKELEAVSELQQEIKNLRKENEKSAGLISQMETANAQRPPVEGRENGIEEVGGKQNIIELDYDKLLVQKDDQISKLKATVAEKEEEFNKINEQVKSLRAEVEKHHNLAEELEKKLNEQKDKNNDLRRLNHEVMVAYKSTEKRLIVSLENNSQVLVQKSIVDEGKETKALVSRIFPDIEVSGKCHEDLLTAFEERLRQTVEESKNSSLKYEELDLANKNLQALVNHYKQIIYDTESMLNKLQNHIESEEKRWQAQLRVKDVEIDNLRTEITEIKNKASAGVELTQKVAELEARQSESKGVSSSTPDLGVVEKLQQEKDVLYHQLQEESKKLEGLNSEVNQLRAQLEKTHVALANEEQNNFKLAREIKEMSELKNTTSADSSSSEQLAQNGPPNDDSPQSETTLEKQSPLAVLKQTLLKNPELECFLIDTNGKVQSEDNDNDSLTNSCDMTNKVAKNNFHGQQKKKSKKKRKGGSGKK
uniref:Ribosome receptor lysine/proline rich domain-containing protein n=1 Tax=Trichogramma kaykai TaxID=54128 RepID=A0ABD2XI16_9HYME